MRGIDNLSTGSLENLAAIRRDISFEKMDLQHLGGLKAACEGADYVLHQGALASVPRSVADPIGTHESNIIGTPNVIRARATRRSGGRFMRRRRPPTGSAN